MPTKFPNPQENDSGSSMRHPLYDVPLPVLRMVRYWLLWMLAPNTANVGIFIVVLGVAGIMLTLERYWWSIGLLIFAGAWALASWLYNILKVKRRAEESDNDGPSKKHEAFMAIVIVIVATSVPVYYINQARIAHDVQRQKDEARKLLDERLDSYQHLTTTAYLAPTASPSLTLFTIRNGGKSYYQSMRFHVVFHK